MHKNHLNFSSFIRLNTYLYILFTINLINYKVVFLQTSNQFINMKYVYVHVYIYVYIYEVDHVIYVDCHTKIYGIS